jgi:hypothetical protein
MFEKEKYDALLKVTQKLNDKYLKKYGKIHYHLSVNLVSAKYMYHIPFVIKYISFFEKDYSNCEVYINLYDFSPLFSTMYNLVKHCIHEDTLRRMKIYKTGE